MSTPRGLSGTSPSHPSLSVYPDLRFFKPPSAPEACWSVCRLSVPAARNLQESMISPTFFFPVSQALRIVSDNGEHWINVRWMNEWMHACTRYTHRATQIGTPLTHPAFCFPTIPAHPLPVFPQGERCISIFLSVFQMLATLTSVLFQLVYKNKDPARSCVQNSPRCQNKFIPLSISRATANPRWPSSFLLPKCIKTLLK